MNHKKKTVAGFSVLQAKRKVKRLIQPATDTAKVIELIKKLNR